MKAVEAIKAVTAKQRESRLTCPRFGPRGSLRYDARSYTLMGQERVSLNTQEGRVSCRLVLGERQAMMVHDPAWPIGGADLVWRRGVYYLHVTQSQEAPDPSHAPPAGGTRGVDLGIVTLATASEGEHFTGARVHLVRARTHLRRHRLQTCGTRNATRRIRRMGQREARFQKDTNHCIRKQLVHKAVVARQALALEDLSGLRERTTVRRVNRYERHSWAFYHLRHYLTSKAAWVGIPVVVVDPRDTSRTCPRCGYCSKDNRKSQAVFACTNPHMPCAFAGSADHVGAINSSRRAEPQWVAVNRPLASLREG
jgi:IS605 OrfB family transposase